MTRKDKQARKNKGIDFESLRKLHILQGRMPTYKIWRDLIGLVERGQFMSPKQYATMEKCYKNSQMYNTHKVA
jgi:hypothetical protein